MYGTVARLRVKPGMEGRLEDVARSNAALNIPGHIETKIYRMDKDPNEVFLVVAFDSKDSYFKNAQSPEQDGRYRQMRELLAEDPEWNDGEIAFNGR